MRYLAGDIGGTNSRFAIFDGKSLSHVESQPNGGVADPYAQVEEYCRRYGPVDGVCLGVAGPVVEGRVEMTNRGWVMDEQELSERLEAPVLLMNDFKAQALAMGALPGENLIPIGTPRADTPGHMAVIGAGTGLGEALLVWDGTKHIPVAGEGSHGRFAPKSEREMTLLEALAARWPEHVSVERVVSGPGLVNIYEALRGEEPRDAEMADVDPAVVITRKGLNKECDLCAEVLNIFVDTLADEAAGLVLKCNAVALYVSGGIPPRILPVLEKRFRVAFENKGRYRKNMERVAVYVVTYPDTGLLGAGVGAMRA